MCQLSPVWLWQAAALHTRSSRLWRLSELEAEFWPPQHQWYDPHKSPAHRTDEISTSTLQSLMIGWKKTNLAVSKDSLIKFERSGGVTAGDVISKQEADDTRATLSTWRVYRPVTHNWLHMTYICWTGECSTGVFSTGVLQYSSVGLAASDEWQVELVLVQRNVIAVNRLTCRLLHGRQVHYGTAHHIILALPLCHGLQEENRNTYMDNKSQSVTFPEIIYV